MIHYEVKENESVCIWKSSKVEWTKTCT